MAEQVCAVCGMGGYWVGYDPSTRTVRCVNHIGPMSTFQETTQSTEVDQ